MLSLKKLFASRTAHRARYHSLGKPGPAIRQVWLCLHGHGQTASDLAAQLVNLHTPERLLLLPEALTTVPTKSGQPYWFRPGSMGPDLALVRAYLDELAMSVLVACPPGTSLFVLGYREGATAASTWLAGNRFPYDQLILWAAEFPESIRRQQLFADLPHSPVLIISSTAGEIDTSTLMREFRTAGLPTKLNLMDGGPLPLAALNLSGEAPKP